MPDDTCAFTADAFDVDHGNHVRRCELEPNHWGQHHPTILVTNERDDRET